MALQKQLVPLDMSRGLDTKVDAKQEEPGFLRKAENIVYETLKLFRKRNGYDNIDLAILGGSTISNISLLAKYKNELLALAPTRLYAYASSRMAWINKGALYSVGTKSASIAKNADSLNQCDVIVVDDFKVYTWESSDGTVRYSVQDLSDDSFVVSNLQVATGTRPVIGSINNDVYIIYATGANISYKSFSILQPQTLSSATLVASDRDITYGLIDARNAANSVVVVYNADNSGDDIVIFKINEDGTPSGLIGIASEACTHALNIFIDSQSRIIVTYSDGTNLKALIYPLNLNANLLAPTVIESVLGAAPTLTLNLTADIIVTSATQGPTRNGDTITLSVAAAAANPTNTVLVAVTGTIDAVTITITPNDGTNNSATPVNLTTAELAELITNGSVVGKNITLTDAGSLLDDLSATGGNSTALADGGEGDGINGTFAGGTILPVVTCTATSIVAETYKVYYEVQQSGSSDNYVKEAQITLGGTVTGKTVFNRAVGLAADSFTHDGAIYVPVVHESTLQSTYFLLDSDAKLVTKWANQTASGVNSRGVLPTVASIDSSKYLISGLFRNRLKSDNGTFFSTNGIGAATLNFSPDFPFSNAELADGLHICAGLLRLYDGSTVVEHGFTVFPESLAASSTATSGGNLSDGSYAYKAVYRWTDNTGKDHRSAPTLTPLEVTLSGGGSTQTSVISVPTLRITDKSNVIIEVYRTENAGTTYYKVSDDSSPLENDKTVDSVTFTDTISDTALISKEALYTTGDVLENLQAPAASQVCAYNGDRLAIVGEEANRVYFSKQVSEERPVEFTDLIYRDVDPTGGPITAIKNMASKLLIFENDASFYVSGEGPTNTGVQDTLTRPEILATDIGCTSPQSMVLTPSGLMFKSRKGIQFCGANLAINYVGARVEGYNSQTVKAASIVGELNQVRFLLSEERALIYNYNLDMWGTFENHGGTSSIVIGNDYYYLREDGAIYKENRSSFSDASSPIKLRLETGWLTANALQGYQRAYHAMILANFKSAHKLRIKIAYDYVDAWVQETVVTPTDFLDVAAYGADATYGASSPYGGDSTLYQLRVDFERQKCQAIKLLIEDAQDEVGEGLSISAVTFRVGLKEGTNKIAASNQFGSSS